jgi:hypothetical protein
VLRVHRFFLVLLFAAAASLAQDAPTGITKAGGFSLIRSEGKVAAGPAGTIASTTDLFAGGFQSTDYSKLPVIQPQFTTIDPCIITQLGQTTPTTVDPTAVTPLDAGPFLHLSGPNGDKQFPSVKSGYGGILGGGVALPIPGFPAPPPLYLDQGTYTIDNGAGGADIGPFTATLTVPSPLFTWTNADDNLTIDRSVGVDVVWTGGDPASKVFIGGSVSLVDAAFKVTGGAAFTCVADNSAGHFFVSPDVLGLLPASVSVANLPTSPLTVSSYVQTKFDAPGSDTSSFTFTSGGTRTVTFK